LKLKQFQKTTLVIYEITDVSLKITPQSILKKETREILFENILVKDMYELPYHNKSLLPYIYVFVFVFGSTTPYSFINPRVGWTLPIVFGVLTFLYVFLYFIKRKKIYIPTKDQGMISLFNKQPDKKSVERFIEILEEKVNHASAKIPKKTDLNEFIGQYFAKDK
jgi:hypothetical protein